jgi:osmotically-inducible protein OsmY
MENHMHNAAVASAIERYLAEQLGLHVGVRVSGGLMTIVGRVPSAEACEAVTDVVAGLAPAYRVDNRLETQVLRGDQSRQLGRAVVQCGR